MPSLIFFIKLNVLRFSTNCFMLVSLACLMQIPQHNLQLNLIFSLVCGLSSYKPEVNVKYKIKSIDHVLLHCGKARLLWELLFSLFRMYRVIHASIKETLLGW